MLRVALTGGAASGKSTVAAVLRQCGALLSQSDEVARAMMEPGEAVYLAIVNRFGPTVVCSDGRLNRPALAELAFRGGRLAELNEIVHPPVIHAQSEWLRRVAREHPDGVAVVESALVLETVHGAVPAGAEVPTPWRSQFDCVVLVAAPEAERLERYVQRRLAAGPAGALDRESIVADARARFAVQMPEAEKRALADLVLENDATLPTLQERARVLYREFSQRARDTADEAM